MKRYISFILVIVLLVCVTGLFAGDTYEQTVKRKLFPSGVLYYGTVDMIADSIGNFYTNSMFIGNCNTNNAMIWAVCSEPGWGTEDVNVFVQYSQEYDGTWVLSSNASGAILDALGTTTKIDTINVVTAVSDYVYPSARWQSFKFDGQAGNTHCTVSWYCFLKFDSNIESDWKMYWGVGDIAPIMIRTD